MWGNQKYATASAQTNLSHTERIHHELHDAGVTRFGMMKFANRFLPNIIHSDEHIHATVYGRYREGSGLLSFSEGMLVATNLRVIFLDHKPGYTHMDEIGYDVVSGVNISTSGLFSSITLYTKIANFTVRFANPHCASLFANYVEKRRLEAGKFQPF